MKQDDIITQLFYRREYGNKKLDLLITQGRKKMANSKQSDKDQLSFFDNAGWKCDRFLD
jgi:restriction endonuclease